MQKTLLTLANTLKKDIGAHYRSINMSDTRRKHDAYLDLQAKSDKAVSLAKYLIMHLESRHDAVTFANMVGMPGYINMR